MTAYKELYNYCQTLEPKVSTRAIRTKAEEITGKKVAVIKTALDLTKIRGYFLSAANQESPIVKMYGHDVIVLGRGMNTCWDRFIQTKELMHLFDDSANSTGTPEQFKGLLRDFETMDATDASPQYLSEVRSLWMALGCLCPERHRQEFIAAAAKNHIDHYGIALRLRIPEAHVRHLFHPNYLERINLLLND